jgi:hypothetical protein
MAASKTAQEHQWQIMTQLAHIVIDNYGIIFGGFVRDLILREHSLDLNVMPRDIDIFMCEERMAEFIMDCKMHHLVLRKQGPAMCVSDYVPHVERDDCAFARYHVTLESSFWRRASSRFPVSLDVSAMIAQCEAIPPVTLDIISSEMDLRNPFLGPPDFECNALFLDKYGLQLGQFKVDDEDTSLLARHRKISSIMEDIVLRRARLILPTAQHPATIIEQQTAFGRRAKSLMERGWTVVDSCISSCNEAEYAGHCILCHDTVPREHVRFMCCDARYHVDCMCSLMRSSTFVYECPMCRKGLSLGVLPLCEVLRSSAAVGGD